MKKFNLKKLVRSMFQQKFMVLPITLVAVSIIWLGYMDMPFETFGLFIVSFGLGWWIRGNMD